MWQHGRAGLTALLREQALSWSGTMGVSGKGRHREERVHAPAENREQQEFSQGRAHVRY